VIDDMRIFMHHGVRLWHLSFIFPYLIAILTISLTVLSTPSFAGEKTITRTCKGATLVRYTLIGSNKSHSLVGPYKFIGKGTSTGLVPSPAKARRRACENAARAAAESRSITESMKAVCSHKVDYITFIGGIGKSKNEKQWFNKLNEPYPIYGNCNFPLCGDGVVGENEECDDGDDNSDIEPDACRLKCWKPACGDGVADSGEECDGEDFNNHICRDFTHKPTGQQYSVGRLDCRTDCTFDFSNCRFCGDGSTAHTSEECDDGNLIDDDGCNSDCTICVSLTPNDVNTNIEIISDTEICTHDYEVDDYGELGVIIIRAPNTTLDCDGASLSGQGDGVGIYVQRSDNVTITNCRISNFDVGIFVEDSEGLRIESRSHSFRNNNEDVVYDQSSTQPSSPPPPRTKPSSRKTSPQKSGSTRPARDGLDQPRERRLQKRFER
jgi:cysteine-rich repeat protein/parallel beta-helix repeat protein